MATPIVPGNMLLLENMYGSDVSSRGGTCGFGGESLVQVPWGCAPFEDLDLENSLCADLRGGRSSPNFGVPGSDWKGSISLSLWSLRRLQNAQKTIKPAIIAAAPIDAAEIPMICGFVNVNAGVDVGFVAPSGKAGEEV